ncbi:hypothetical protein AB0F10_44970, partial [Actinoplanes sp. NPDC026623]
FATDLLAVAGIAAPAAGGDPRELRAALAAAGTTVACLCGTDEAYAEEADAAARALAAAGATGVWLAGRPAERPGVTGHLYDGCDVADVLETVLKELEIA